MTREEIIPMDDKLHPVGTLFYEDMRVPDGGADWRPHRNIWRVIAHKECQEFPHAPVGLACAIELVRSEDIDE